MRTTVRIDDDVMAAVEQLRRERNPGLSEALNELARTGLNAIPNQRSFRQRSHDLGLRIDVSNVSEAVELLDEMDGEFPIRHQGTASS